MARKAQTNQLGPLADVYAQGAVLNCMLMGRTPLPVAMLAEAL